jgi:hypothetical protein
MRHVESKARTTEGLPGQSPDASVHADVTKDGCFCPVCHGMGWLWIGCYVYDGTCGTLVLPVIGACVCP